jgi:hypothetical protein
VTASTVLISGQWYIHPNPMMKLIYLVSCYLLSEHVDFDSLLVDLPGSNQQEVSVPIREAIAGSGRPRRPNLTPFQPAKAHSILRGSLNNVRASLSLLHKPQRSSLIIKNVEGLFLLYCYFYHVNNSFADRYHGETAVHIEACKSSAFLRGSLTSHRISIASSF